MSTQNTSIQKLYQELRRYRGSIEEVSRRSGRSREWVRMILKGDYFDTNVIKAANRVLLDRHRDAVRAMQASQDAIHMCQEIEVSSI